MSTVVLAEDDPDIRDLVTMQLEFSGYTVVATGDGDTAVRACREHRPDVVLLDVSMPGRSGLDVCRTLRATPGLAAVPILMLTARARPSDLAAAVDAGASDYLVKPFSPAELVARVSVLVGGQLSAPPAPAPPDEDGEPEGPAGA